MALVVQIAMLVSKTGLLIRILIRFSVFSASGELAPPVRFRPGSPKRYQYWVSCTCAQSSRLSFWELRTLWKWHVENDILGVWLFVLSNLVLGPFEKKRSMLYRQLGSSTWVGRHTNSYCALNKLHISEISIFIVDSGNPIKKTPSWPFLDSEFARQ